MTNIQAQLEQLLELNLKLNNLLDDEEWELFQQQQEIFSDKIKYLLDSSSEQELGKIIEQLKLLESNVQLLQQRADVYFKQLKEKSLLLQRNKSKIKAYK